MSRRMFHLTPLLMAHIYLFDTDGVMQDGLKWDIAPVATDGFWGGVPYKGLAAGTYYFNNGSTGVKGQMMYGKQTIEKDGETYRLYFDKNTGKAVTDAVVDGSYYGHNGDMVRAEDGNTNALVRVVTDGNGTPVEIRNGSSGVVTDKIAEGSLIIVTSNGKVKTSTGGYTKVDGDQYQVVRPANRTDGTTLWYVKTKAGAELH